MIKGKKNKSVVRSLFYSVYVLAVTSILIISGNAHSQISDNKLDLAYNYLNNGQTDLAINLFEEYASSNPSETKIFLQLGYAYKQQKNLIKAKENFTYVYKNSVNSEEINTAKSELDYMNKGDDLSLLNKAYETLNLGNTGEAINMFEDYITRNPRSTSVYLQLAYLYKQQGNTDKAITYFQHVIDNAVDAESISKSQSEIENLYRQKYAVTTPEKTYTGTSSSDDLNEAYNALNSGNTKKAIDIFESYLKTHSDDTKIYMQLAYIYDKEKNYSKAIQYFDYVAAISNNRDEIDNAKQSAMILRQMNAYRSFRSLEIYFYNAYDSYYQNYISNFLGHLSFKMGKYVDYGFYGDIYMDARSKKTNILNDRYLEAGGFMRFKFSNHIGLEMRLGYFRELDIDKNGVNFKPILYMGTRFGDAPVYLSRKTTKTENFYFDIYSTELYDSKYKNLFAQIQLKEVLRYMTGGYSYLEFYLMQMAQADSRQLSYNNYGEASIGLSFKPNLANFPALFIEGTNRINFVDDNGNYFQGEMKSIFQVKAGFIINFNLAL